MAVGNIITPVGANGNIVPAIQLGTVQNLAVAAAAGSSAATANAFGASTTMIMVSVNIGSTATGVRIATGTTPTASATTTWLPGTGVYFFAVQPGWKLAALSNDTNTTNISITEAASWG
jgi:hypothetical protein